MKLLEGQTVVVRGLGVGAVTACDVASVTVRFANEGSIKIDADAVETTVRRAVAAPVARKWLAQLCTKPTETEIVFSESFRHFHRASREHQLLQVQFFFQRPKALPTAPERERLATVSEHFVQEIAAALGASEESVRSALRRGKPGLASSSTSDTRGTHRSLRVLTTVATNEHFTVSGSCWSASGLSSPVHTASMKPPMAQVPLGVEYASTPSLVGGTVF